MTDSVRQPTPPAGSLHCPNCGAAVGLDETQCRYCQAALATVSCPTCFTRVFIGAAFCPQCGTRAARQDEGHAAPEVCPRCKTPMGAVTVGALPLAECATCWGVWVDAGAFDRLCGDRESQAAVIHRHALQDANAGAAAVARADKFSYRPCPRCRKMMNRVNFAKYSGVVLDVCHAHGTFFDRDELHRVVSFIQAGGMDRMRERDRQDLAEAEWRFRSLHQGGGSAGLSILSADANAGGSGAQAFDAFLRFLFHSQ